MSIPGLVLWMGVGMGHIAILSYSLNWWYGQPLNHTFLKGVRYLHGLLVLAVPVGLWLNCGWDPSILWKVGSAKGWRDLPAAYVIGCCTVSFGLLPVVTLTRLRRRAPALVQNHTRTIDVAARLGYKPIGQGKYRTLARLPGNNIFTVDFAEKTLCLPNLPPALDGLTILHLTDLHLCGSPDREFHQQVMDVCRDWDPDLVALTGDVVDSDKHHRWILPVLGRLRWRLAAFAVLGNHDTWYDPGLVRRRLRRLGMDVLGNRWKQLEVRGQPLVVIGNEGPWIGPAPDLTDCPPDVFRLCLSHTPDNMPWARRQRIDLMLAGHNHGGQIRFPIIGSVLVPSRFSRRYDCGTFEEDGTVLHVCRGLGGQQPLRYHCRPEVAKIILQAGPPKS